MRPAPRASAWRSARASSRRIRRTLRERIVVVMGSPPGCVGTGRRAMRPSRLAASRHRPPLRVPGGGVESPRPAEPVRTASRATAGLVASGRRAGLIASALARGAAPASAPVGLGGPSVDGRHQGWLARSSRMATGVAMSSPRGGSCPARASCARRARRTRASPSRSCSLSLSRLSLPGGEPRDVSTIFPASFRRDLRQDLRAGPRGMAGGAAHVRRNVRQDLRRQLRREARGQIRVRALSERVLVDGDVDEPAARPAVGRVPDVALALQRPAELLDVVRRQAGLLAEGRPARAERPRPRARLRAEPAEHGVLVPGHPAELEVLVDRPAPLEEVVGAGRPRLHVSLSA